MNVYLEKYLEQKYFLDKVEKIIEPMHKIGLSHFAYNEFYVLISDGWDIISIISLF